MNVEARDFDFSSDKKPQAAVDNLVAATDFEGLNGFMLTHGKNEGRYTLHFSGQSALSA